MIYGSRARSPVAKVLHSTKHARTIRPMNQRGEKETLTQAELAKVLQKHYRQFVAGVRFVARDNGEVACEVDFAQQGLPLRVVGPRH